jgi:hypothetical protein
LEEASHWGHALEKHTSKKKKKLLPVKCKHSHIITSFAY